MLTADQAVTPQTSLQKRGFSANCVIYIIMLTAISVYVIVLLIVLNVVACFFSRSQIKKSVCGLDIDRLTILLILD